MSSSDPYAMRAPCLIWLALLMLLASCCGAAAMALGPSVLRALQGWLSGL